MCMTPRQPVIISARYSGYQLVKSCFYKQTAGFNTTPALLGKGDAAMRISTSLQCFPAAFTYERQTDAGGVETVFLMNASCHSLYDALEEAYWIGRNKSYSDVLEHVEKACLHVCKVAHDFEELMSSVAFNLFLLLLLYRQYELH